MPPTTAACIDLEFGCLQVLNKDGSGVYEIFGRSWSCRISGGIRGLFQMCARLHVMELRLSALRQMLHFNLICFAFVLEVYRGYFILFVSTQREGGLYSDNAATVVLFLHSSGIEMHEIWPGRRPSGTAARTLQAQKNKQGRMPCLGMAVRLGHHCNMFSAQTVFFPGTPQTYFHRQHEQIQRWGYLLPGKRGSRYGWASHAVICPSACPTTPMHAPPVTT